MNKRRPKEEIALDKQVKEEQSSLYDKYVLLPLSSMLLQNPHAVARRKYWEEQGLVAGEGRNTDVYEGLPADASTNVKHKSSSFNPVLCEVVYKWFAPENAFVIDPFAGGITSAAVASRLGLKFVGFDIRKEQIDSNYASFSRFEQGNDIKPLWICGDSKKAVPEFLAKTEEKPNFFFTCPPYWNLEKYSELEGDISNIKSYEDFLREYKEILKVSLSSLQEGDYAAIVVGDIRDEFTGYMLNFDSTTIEYFKEFGFELANRIFVANHAGSATLRADKYMRYKKVVKTHQDLLVFQKPYSLKTITELRKTMSDEEIAEKLNMAIRQIHRYSRLEGRKLYGK